MAWFLEFPKIQWKAQKAVPKYWLILSILGVVIAWPAVAQTPDPFEAAPAPAAPTPPSHGVRPPPAPAPAPAPPPPPSVGPAIGWDGVWQGDYHCAPTQNTVVRFQVIVEIKNGRISSMTGDLNGAGTPGYQAWSGEIGPGGAASILWTGISKGPPGYDRPRGEAFSERIDGRFIGDSFVGATAGGAGGCELQLKRFG